MCACEGAATSLHAAFFTPPDTQIWGPMSEPDAGDYSCGIPALIFAKCEVMKHRSWMQQEQMMARLLTYQRPSKDQQPTEVNQMILSYNYGCQRNDQMLIMQTLR